MQSMSADVIISQEDIRQTSTAELLNVRHAGAGLMKGRPKGPDDLFPCGVYHAAV